MRNQKHNGWVDMHFNKWINDTFNINPLKMTGGISALYSFPQAGWELIIQHYVDNFSYLPYILWDAGEDGVNVSYSNIFYSIK